jgi:hypothetical protein
MRVNDLSQATGRRVHAVRMDDALSDARFALEIINCGRPLVDRAHIWRALQRRRPSLERKRAVQAAADSRQMAAAWAALTRAA